MKSIPLSQISKKMRRVSPVFISGAARSGTTLLYLTLQKHSSFGPKFIDLTESHIFAYANASYLFKREYPDSEFLYNYMLKNSSLYKNFLTSIKRIQAFHQLINIKNLTRRISNRLRWLWLIGFNYCVIRCFFYYAQAARRCHRIVEKTPGNELHIPQILYAFPKSKIVYIYRHPVDVYSSYKRRLDVELRMDKKRNQLKWLTIKPEEFCSEYKRSVEIVLKTAKSPLSSIYLVKYENLTINPNKEIFNLCKFLDEPYEEDITEEYQSDFSKWKPDPYLFGPITSKTKNWKDHISFNEAIFIETNLKSTMKKIAYHSYTNSF